MSELYYRCNNCGFQTLVYGKDKNEPPILDCRNCKSKVFYSKNVEQNWINEVDKEGKRIRMEFKGSNEADCVNKACIYFQCDKKDIDYYIVKSKGIFSPLVICAWKPSYNIDKNAIKIVTNASNVNGWIAINQTDKIISLPEYVSGALSVIDIKYNKIKDIKYKESAGSVECELILEPYNKVSIWFYPRERFNVDLLIDALFNDLPQSQHDIYSTCFFKKSDILKNAKLCHITFRNKDIDLRDSCFIWKNADFLCICDTVIRNGIKIKISDIKYYRIVGEKYVTTEVTGGGGGITGDIVGGNLIGNIEPMKPIKSNSTIHDEQKVLLYSNDLSKILCFNSQIYKILLELLPEKEYESVIHAQQQTQCIESTSSNTTDIKSKLQQLKSMYEEDLITEEEYNNKKQELLNKI